MDTEEIKKSLYAQFFNFRPSKGDKRRIKILEATIALIAREGIEAVSFESIGKKSKMLRAHVAYYYPDREKLIEDAVKFVVATVQKMTVDAVSIETDEKKWLQAFIDATFKWVESFPSHPPVILLLFYYGGRSGQNRWRKMHHEVRELGAKRLQAVISPLLPEATPAERYEIAKQVQNLTTGNLVDHVTTRPKKTLSKIHQQTLRQAYQIAESSIKH